MPPSYLRLGIDVGGTFTDVCLVDGFNRQWIHKVPSTPVDQSNGIAHGLTEILSLAQAQAEAVIFLAHGTTVATNAVLEHKLAPVGLLTTQGFRDLLEIRRQKRPDLYDLNVDQPPPLVLRHLRLEVPERLTYTGEVLMALDEAAVRSAAEVLCRQGVQSIAVCFLYAYLNPEHERLARAILLNAYPHLAVCLSHEVLPEFREFERFSTTAANAALVPVLGPYLTNFASRTAAIGITVRPYIMQSNGGVASIDTATALPVHTVLSGPSAGVIGAIYIGRQCGFDNLITLDMGGTSTDVSLVAHGVPRITGDKEIAGNPLRIPAIDIHTIGAGGGSIARVDAGLHLKVGPESAGAWPGPAAYGHGGTLPTVTDANVALGRLNPQQMLGGRMTIDAESARQALGQHVAQPLGLALDEAARGVVAVVNTNMALAARLVSAEKGYDPRDFVLMAFGGAGPLHAAYIAEELGIRRILIPPRPGILCALGLLVTDLRSDFSQSLLCLADCAALPQINAAWAALAARAAAWWQQEDIAPAAQLLEGTADFRYLGQHFELRVKANPGHWTESDLTALIVAFHAEHERQYAYHAPEEAVQLVTLRATAYGLVDKSAGELAPDDAPEGGDVLRLGERWVDWGGQSGRVLTPIYNRVGLRPEVEIIGPAIIEQMDSTTVVPPDYQVTLLDGGSLLLESSLPATEGGDQGE